MIVDPVSQLLKSMILGVWQEADGWWFEPVKGPPQGPFKTEQEAERAAEADVDEWARIDGLDD